MSTTIIKILQRFGVDTFSLLPDGRTEQNFKTFEDFPVDGESVGVGRL